MTDKIFNTVSDTVQKVADKTGLTYKQVNVYGMFVWIGLTIALAIKAYTKGR